uniref:Uncharacterized protein n=1 Tax=Glossina palpalis gambiensis TaxID=67801 RepID=A0A1B0BUE7_9MUSC
SLFLCSSFIIFYLKALDSTFDAFNKVQTKIEENDFDEISQPNRSKYDCIATMLKVCISRLNNSDSNQTIHVSHAILSDEKYNTVKLPKIELCEFSGDVTTLIAWFDEFTSLVHNNKRLNTFAKLHHLVSKFSPAARAPIADIKIIAENYEIILQRLKDRFQNKKIIEKQHIKQIFEHPKIIHANAADLRELIDTMIPYSLSAADRLNKVHALKLCVNCLKFKKYNLSDCTSKGRCPTCGKGHHSLLHFERPQVANYTASKHNQINETNHIEPAENANHNMSDQAQPKNFAA